MPRTHVIGAGLAGLSAAVRLAEAGHKIVLHEAGPQAGGRCRSYFDEVLGCRIDNGNHLLMSGNSAAMAYLDTIGAADTLVGPRDSRFPFVDLGTGERWELSPNRGPLPWWLLDAKRRVPGSRFVDYLSALRIARAGPADTVTALVGGNRALFRRFWEPLAVAALNTEADQGAAALLWPVLTQSFGRGAGSCRPLVARDGLSESFIDPALAWLALKGGRLFTGSRVRAIGFTGDRATSLDLGSEIHPVAPGDSVVVAVPPAIAAALVPDLTVPNEYRSIVNAHFRVASTLAENEVRILGVIGGTAEWVFRRRDLASVTVSAATRIVDDEAEVLAWRLWGDVAAALDLLAEPMPPWRIVKEKRATFAQTPHQLRRRPATATRWRNLVLAGDWTDTGLPATIEGAIRSGVTAACCVRDTA
ncbi:MAG: hydroxysqualene dehydroxylase [Aliidongia sp.]|jgi:squalene-associated FAD-dependent desaturase|nr:hydroxysqualene dehydroxylase [Aliidongia sp.]